MLDLLPVIDNLDRAIGAWTGDADGAFIWLEKSRLEEAGSFFRSSAFLKPIKSDPRWLPLLERAGLSDAQLAAIEFEVKLPD